MSTFEIIRGVEGDSLALDDTRICGPKPWGGGYVIKTFHTDGIYDVIGKNEYSKLIAENAELREQRARLFDKTLELGTENAKLRELVRVMAYCMQESTDCDGCKLNDGAGRIEALDAFWACNGLHDRMRELGIEV